MEIALMIEGQDGLTWGRWQRLAKAVEDLALLACTVPTTSPTRLRRTKTRSNCGCLLHGSPATPNASNLGQW